MREVEKQTALSGMLAEAKSTKRIADDLQAKEETAMQAEIESQMLAEFARLRERQKGEAEMNDRSQQRLDPLRAAAKRLRIPPKTMTARQSVVGTFGIIPAPHRHVPEDPERIVRVQRDRRSRDEGPVVDDKAFKGWRRPRKQSSA
jgi:hypothetical protein